MKMAILLTSLIALSQGSTELERVEAPSDFNLKTTRDALDCLFMPEGNGTQETDFDGLWLLEGRVVPHRAAEWQFSLRDLGSRGAIADLQVLRGKALLSSEELEKVETCSELREHFRVVKISVEADKCPALADSIEQLRALQLPSIPDSSLRLHAGNYELVAETREGDVFTWILNGWSDRPERVHPLVGWTESLRRAIERCGASPEAPVQ